jgi:hypothetical protein
MVRARTCRSTAGGGGGGGGRCAEAARNEVKAVANWLAEGDGSGSGDGGGGTGGDVAGPVTRIWLWSASSTGVPVIATPSRAGVRTRGVGEDADVPGRGGRGVAVLRPEGDGAAAAACSGAQSNDIM